MAINESDYLKELFLQKLELSLSFHSNKRLEQAMRYALLGSGKRLRPMMVLLSAVAFKKQQSDQVIKCAMPAALAVEYIHTYSLIHDDLPAMDNDDYRRGKLSVHRQFDEALAILTGDALLADAFSLLAAAPNNAAKQCQELALASGRHGLVAGQAYDLEIATKKDWGIIHAQKTARLFEACAVLGALSQGASENEVNFFRAFGHNFGMAFQVKDDMMDKSGMINAVERPLAYELDHLILETKKALVGLGDQAHLEKLVHITFY